MKIAKLSTARKYRQFCCGHLQVKFIPSCS